MLLAFITGLTLSLLSPTTAVATRTGSADASAWVEEIGAKAEGFRPDVLKLALSAVECAGRRGLAPSSRLLTVIDYSLPSSQPRLWVIDRESRQVLFEELVAHGRNSGEDRTSSFSNALGSLQTSLGLFVTDDTYVGRNGYSLRLHGLEPGVNDRALERAIVMHGAPYVSLNAVKQLGRLGRSWGCPAVSPEAARKLIDTIKGGTPVFAYYPDSNWLSSSRFLSGCN
jgi:L,D-transpeptidase catalytic domain